MASDTCRVACCCRSDRSRADPRRFHPRRRRCRLRAGRRRCSRQPPLAAPGLAVRWALAPPALRLERAPTPRPSHLLVPPGRTDLPATSRIDAAGAAVCAGSATGAHNAPMVRDARKKGFIPPTLAGGTRRSRQGSNSGNMRLTEAPPPNSRSPPNQSLLCTFPPTWAEVVRWEVNDEHVPTTGRPTLNVRMRRR